MLLCNDGDTMKINGREYTVGMEIFCNEKSDYAGLTGRILEIRDGDDKETDNDTVDIVCELDIPEDAETALKLEKRFSQLYGKPMILKNISLDYTIMAPEMIDLPANGNPAEENGGETDGKIIPETESKEKSDDPKKKEHDEAEAKRKAEWEAKQKLKKETEEKALAEMRSMSDGDITDASVRKLGADIERLTRRNMKICVADHINDICSKNPEFARSVMHPRKSMINCFRYISKKAYEYLKEDMEMNGEKPENGGYGDDVPDDLCYMWAEEYFKDPNAEIDREKDEKFVPKTYYGGSASSKANNNKKETAKAKAAVTENKISESEQIGLFGGAA